MIFSAVWWILDIVRWIFSHEWTEKAVPKELPRRSLEIMQKADVEAADKRLKLMIPEKTGLRYAVVGGSGSVGANIVKMLLHRGEKSIMIIDMAETKRFADEPCVTFAKGDITDLESVEELLKGVDVVFHTAALIQWWTRHQWQHALPYKVNVVGTENIIAACKKNGVKALIATSTSTVTFSRFSKGLTDFTEDAPYADTPPNHYISTKILAEKAVRAANNPKGLHTVSLRPCSAVFGPDDKFILEGTYKTGIMTEFGNNQLMDYVYVENVAVAHLLAEAGLEKNLTAVGGKAFNIVGNPLRRWEWHHMIESAEPKHKWNKMAVPRPIQFCLGIVSEAVQGIFRGKLSLGDLDLLSTSALDLQYIDFTASNHMAEKVLSYTPPYSVYEGMRKTFDTIKSRPQ